jgi:hypothetical protein
MSSLLVNGGSELGSALQKILDHDAIEPGSEPSYQLCKIIYTNHPLGAKIAENSIKMAQSQEREITIPKGPEERCREVFLKEWSDIGANEYIFNTKSMSRIYGISSIAVLIKGEDPAKALDLEKLAGAQITFNIFDPLNTAGSLVLSQRPNEMDFLKPWADIRVEGQTYHSSRTRVVLNEQPIYLSYTTSAYGWVGRSAYQRALFPLKSFIQTMKTDDMVARKAGVLIAKLRPPGSVIDNIMQKLAGIKRAIIQMSKTDNVISITTEESIETLNMQNLDGAYSVARKNILENIASAAGDPAQVINSETFVEGFGEGQEDSKRIAEHIGRLRVQMKPLYDFFDIIVMHRAWTKEFYAAIQEEFPEYKNVEYQTAFQEWRNSFHSEWPSLLTEPDSEKAKSEDVKLKAIVALVEVYAPMLDPENKATLLQWGADNFNELKLIFGTPLELDAEGLIDWLEEQQDQMAEMAQQGQGEGLPTQKPQAPFSSKDSVNPAAVRMALAFDRRGESKRIAR